MASNGNHVVLFPFMSKGHTIPLLHLARLLLRRFPLATVTVFTTPANRPFIDRSLAGTTASVITIPFPHGIPQIPPSVESTDQLPSTSLFPAFATATALMQPRFEAELEKLLPVRLLVSDGFLWWTLESANKFGIPRMVFYGMSNYASAMSREVAIAKTLDKADDDEPFTVTAFPWIKVTRNIVELPDPQSNAVHFEFLMKSVQSTISSYGLLVNSFEELEPAFLDYCNREAKPRVWCVGPLCLVDPPEPIPVPDKPTWARWLDRKLDEGAPVLYVAFGSQVEISAQQLNEIAAGLEKSGAHFLWVIKKKEESRLEDGFEERVKDRGLVVRDWVDQRTTLMHPGIFEPLWMELGAREHMRRGADTGVASDGRATTERKDGGGGAEDRASDHRTTLQGAGGRQPCEVGGGGEEGPGAHGRGGREGGEEEGGGDRRDRETGCGGRRLVVEHLKLPDQ